MSDRRWEQQMVDAVLIKWSEVGVLIDNLDISPDASTIYLAITVPEHNVDRKTEEGEELAGELLARRVKDTLKEMNPNGKSKVLYRIEKGYVMTDRMGALLAQQMERQIKEVRKENEREHQ